MLFSCSPPGAHGPGIFPGQVKGRKKHLTVDIHCHVQSDKAGAMVKDVFRVENEPSIRYATPHTREVNQAQMARVHPQLTSVEQRLADMDAMGIDIQALAPAPFQTFYWTEPELGLATARVVNENIAQIVADHPDRFVGLGTVPLQAPDYAVKELARIVKELGLRGVEINPNVAGEELSDDRFRPFWAKAEALGIVVFMHPIGFTEGRRLTDHYFNNVIGNPLDTTVALGHLIFGGVLDRHPGLKLVAAHGGGYAPSYAGRFDHAFAARPDCRVHIKQPPSTYLKRLYFDTMVFTHHQLEYLVEQYGADHIVMGTDYPYDMGENDPIGFVEGSPKLSDEQRALILGGNAATLLGIEVKPKR
jgi:aminocarboxymuconate-semialdehyde decarboxylase